MDQILAYLFYRNIVMKSAHNNPHLLVQTTVMSLWFYSVASNNLEKWCAHQTTFFSCLVVQATTFLS